MKNFKLSIGIDTGGTFTDICISLDNILVDSYGSKMPINQVGNVSVPDSTMLTIQVWDSALIKSVENAILDLRDYDVIYKSSSINDLIALNIIIVKICKGIY